MLLRIVHPSREHPRLVRARAGAVDNDILAPPIKGVTVRIRKAERNVHLKLLSLRLVAEYSRIRTTHRRPVRRLNLSMVERPLLKIKRAAGIERKAVRRVMCVGRIEPVNHTLADVCLVVAVYIFQEQQLRRPRALDAAIAPLEPRPTFQTPAQD